MAAAAVLAGCHRPGPLVAPHHPRDVRAHDSEPHRWHGVGVGRHPTRRRGSTARLLGHSAAGSARCRALGTRMLVSKAFNEAYREGVIDANPLARAGLKAPSKQRQVEVVPLSVEEVERLAGAAMSQRDRAAILLMAYAGLRAGEIGGLRETDVDWDGKRLPLRQQAIGSRTGKSIAPLKTRAARRTVSIAPSVLAELRALRPAEDGRLCHLCQSPRRRRPHHACPPQGRP